jgi:hypothetical protein
MRCRPRKKWRVAAEMRVDMLVVRHPNACRLAMPSNANASGVSLFPAFFGSRNIKFAKFKLPPLCLIG